MILTHSATTESLVRVVNGWWFTGERAGESENLSKKNVAGGQPRVSVEKGMGTYTHVQT